MNAERSSLLQARRPRLLDLFCGAGGCSVGYERAGFDVVGVDIAPQPNYPFPFMQRDALAVLEVLLDDGDEWFALDDFAAIHASPPCQAHSTMKSMWNAGDHENLIPPTRDLLDQTGLPYVIENVVGARREMRSAYEVCGASLGLRSDSHDLARHRLFETNFPMMVPPCAHGSRPVAGIYGDHVRDRRRVAGSKDRGRDIAIKNADKLAFGRDVMGIDWMTWSELSQAIPPVYTEMIGSQLAVHIASVAAAA